MNKDIQTYNDSQAEEKQVICTLLSRKIHNHFPNAESKIWHGAPVWFLQGNPIVGYWARNDYVQLLFWSGQSFDESGLEPEGSFKAAEARYTDKDQINGDDLARWLEKSERIQWDYKNIVKRRGVLERLK